MKATSLGIACAFFCGTIILAFGQLPDAASGKPTASQKTKSLSTAENRTAYAMQLLGRVESKFLALPPATASTICLQVAQGYGKAGQRKKESELLEQCFRTTLLIQDDSEQRSRTQMNIASLMSTYDQSGLDSFVGVAEPSVRGMVERMKLDKDVMAKRFDEALVRINNLLHLPQFPFNMAVKLMLALPPEREQDRRAIFLAASENYRGAAHDAPRIEDFATMIVRYWKHFPPELVIDAIGDVLKRDKKQSEGKIPMSLTIATKAGEANFSSGYQYRLFQFLPILQEIDPGKAKSLLSENPAVESSLKRFRSGMGSLAPSMNDSGDIDDRFTMTYNMRPENDPKILEDARQQREIAEIAAIAEKYPKEAMKRAAEMKHDQDPHEGYAKTDAFLNIAYALWRTEPDTATVALIQSLTLSKEFPPLARCNYLFRAAGLFVQMKDTASASKVLEEAAALAQKMYEIDTDSDKPNLAFKIDWPSAAAWRGVAVLRSKVSLPEASEMVSKLPDEEIRASAEVTLANSLLGVPLPYNQVREKFEKEYPGSFRGLPIPALAEASDPQ
ncbi:MAG: hypothetical protein JWO13_1235 [Acidobacteriales bacterium]|nr:hypothetical protein [Terriglobales bacterium]